MKYIYVIVFILFLSVNCFAQSNHERDSIRLSWINVVQNTTDLTDSEKTVIIAKPCLLFWWGHVIPHMQICELMDTKEDAAYLKPKN